MTKMPPDNYYSAVYFDCTGSEEYTHETVEECLADYLDGWIEPGRAVEAIIREHTPIEVTGYVRDEVPPTWCHAKALCLAEQAGEWWADEYGDPNGSCFDAKAEEHLAEEIEKALAWVVAQHAVWSCSACGKRTYSAETVIAMMRERCPEWFAP